MKQNIKMLDYFRAFREQNTRLQAVQIGQVRESITLESNTFTVTLGRDCEIESINSAGVSFKMAVGDTPRRLNVSFTPLFRKYREEFITLYEQLEKQVDAIVDAVTDLFSTIVEEDIPELMLERISGAAMSKEPQALVKHTTANRFKKLVLRIETCQHLMEYTYYKTIAKKQLAILVSEGVNSKTEAILQWDLLSFRSGQTDFTRDPALTQCLLFLANYEKIAEVVEKFVAAVKASNKILEA